MHLQRTPKDLPNNPQQQKKQQKWGKNIVLGAHAGCTIDRSRVIRGLTIQQVSCTSTCGLYHWQVAYHMWVDSIESHVYQTRHAAVQSATHVCPFKQCFFLFCGFFLLFEGCLVGLLGSSTGAWIHGVSDICLAWFLAYVSGQPLLVIFVWT